jgi:hypothetical protein
MIGATLLAQSSPAMLCTAAVLLLLWLMRLFTYRRSKLSLPVAEIPPGNEGLTEAFMKAIAMVSPNIPGPPGSWYAETHE